MSAAGWGNPGGGKRTEASSTLGGQLFGPGATPDFGTDENGDEWGDVNSGQARYLGRYTDGGSQVSQSGDYEATEGASKEKPKVSLSIELISNR